MDEIQENKRELYRRNEQIIRRYEENEAKVKEAAEAIRRNLDSSKTNIGPANELLRFFYILEQQSLSDTKDMRRKARTDLEEYINQFRPDEDEVEEEEEEEEEGSNDDDDQPSVDVSPPPVSTTASNVSLPPIVSTPPQQVSTVVSTHQASPTEKVYLSPITAPDCIRPSTLKAYEALLLEVAQYETQYESIPKEREKQLAQPSRDVLNKLREDTATKLEEDLFKYLNGQEYIVGSQVIRIANTAERLSCYKRLTDLILRQLLGGDLNDVKAGILLPLIEHISRHPRHKEFRTIFLDGLHKKCPYTVPLYPKPLSAMNDTDYLKVMGYTEKIENNAKRLETETEFLNRMSGLIRLFWKLAANKIPPFDKDLTFGWQWCSDVLNLPPRPNLTVLLLRVFLDEAGSLMMEAYSKQFLKMIKTIQANLAALSNNSNPSEVARLDTAIQKVLQLSK